MKKVIFIGLIALVLVVACSKESSNPVSSEETWWDGPDPDAHWITVDACVKRIEPSKWTADSVCISRGYYQSTGYTDENCYVGGVKETYISGVACTNDH